MISLTRVVGEQALERAVAEDVVGEIRRDLVALGTREPALLGQMAPDVGDHPLPERGRVDRDVEELRAELADHRRWTAFFSSANGSGAAPVGETVGRGRVGERRSWRSITPS